MSRFRSRRTKLNTEYFSNWEYKRYFWTDFDYTILHDHIMTKKKRGRGDHTPINDIIIMADTETSKSEAVLNTSLIMPEYEIIRPWLLSGSGIKITQHIQNDIPDYKAWKKEHSKYIKISDNGLGVDIVYMELSQMFPYLFPDNVINPTDQLLLLVDTVKDMEPDLEAGKPMDNHICLWTISLRAYHYNIATLWGTKPRDMVECMTRIHDKLPGMRTYIYFHNLSYDYCFLRRFMYEKWGVPEKQLATKPHYPIWIKFENDINIKDSLILSQRSLEKWGKDLDIEHQKAVGSWDYDLIRNQDYEYSEEELKYAEYDTLGGVECLDKFMQSIHKDITCIPYTSTGVLRTRTRDIGRQHNAHEQFKRICIDDLDLYNKAHRIYHGGYTHANRYVVETLVKGDIKCFDFASSYPFVMLSEKFPMEKYTALAGNYKIKDVLDWYKGDFSILCTVKLENVHLKDPRFPMPYIQQSKLKSVTNPIFDNGRLLDADELVIEYCDLDIVLLDMIYKYDNDYVTEVYFAQKDYLPRWFTDLIFSLYKDKSELKFGDPVLYNIQKGLLNSTYGMTAQKSIMPDLTEDYDTGEYYEKEKTSEELEKEYKSYINKRGSILPYQWSLYVTGYATINLFTLGSECCRRWYYSDTDSCYGEDWNLKKLEAYNKRSLEKLRANGYDLVTIQGHEFQLGKAEADGDYIEFKTMGAKRYACRKPDGDIKITVAGVPKKTGAKCLGGDLDKFTKGFVFRGEITGKKTHTMFFNDKIYEDKWGNEIGDSIDLSPCDYLLDSTLSFDWFFDEALGSFEVEVYDEGVIT